MIILKEIYRCGINETIDFGNSVGHVIIRGVYGQ